MEKIFLERNLHRLQAGNLSLSRVGLTQQNFPFSASSMRACKAMKRGGGEWPGCVG